MSLGPVVEPIALSSEAETAHVDVALRDEFIEHGAMVIRCNRYPRGNAPRQVIEIVLIIAGYTWRRYTFKIIVSLESDEIAVHGCNTFSGMFFLKSHRKILFLSILIKSFSKRSMDGVRKQESKTGQRSHSKEGI